MRQLWHPVLAAVLLLATVWTAAPAAALDFPPLTGRVVDTANLLGSVDESRITEQLARHEAETSNQVVVVTLATLQGTTIEDFGYQLGRHWGIGQGERDNGALLIVAPTERKVRIEVGYGLEGNLPDATTKLIIEQRILPAFREGDFPRGISAGVDTILAAIEGTYEPLERDPDEKRFVPIAFFVFMLALVVFPIIAANRLKVDSSSSGWRGGRRRGDRHGGLGGGFGGGFGGGGGGGFSGGGGGFGGGGSSGSW